MKKVSVILPVLDQGQGLYDKVQALLEQTLECQIVLVDMGSTDGSAEIIADCVSQFPEDIRSVRIDGGIGKAWNAGLAEAEGEYVSFLTCGDSVDEDMYLSLYAAAKGEHICGADYEEDGKRRCVGYGSLETEGEKASFIAKPGCVASRIYQRAFLEENGLRFPEEGEFCQLVFDFLTVLKANSAAKAQGCFLKRDANLPGRNDRRWYDRLTVPEQIAQMAGSAMPDLVEYKYMALQMGNVRNVCLAMFDRPDAGQLARIKADVLGRYPNFKNGKYYSATLWEMRQYLEKAVKSPEKAAKSFKWDGLVQMQAALRERIGKA